MVNFPDAFRRQVRNQGGRHPLQFSLALLAADLRGACLYVRTEAAVASQPPAKHTSAMLPSYSSRDGAAKPATCGVSSWCSAY